MYIVKCFALKMIKKNNTDFQNAARGPADECAGPWLSKTIRSREILHVHPEDSEKGSN